MTTQVQPTATISENSSYVTFTTGASITWLTAYIENYNTFAGVFSWDWFQLEEGAVATPFKPYKGLNKAANKLPKKNMIDLSTTVTRAGTTGFTIEGNKITFDATKQDYAGVNFVTPDSWLQGKQITLSCIDRSVGATPMVAYYPAGSQSLTYIGLSGGQLSKTITIPSGATSVRFYIQNDAGARGNFYVTGLQVELGSVVTPYEKFKMVSKAAPPRRNIFDGSVENGSFDATGNVGDNSINIRGISYIKVKPSTAYTFSVVGKGNVNPRFYWYDENKNYISTSLGMTQTAPANAAFMRWHSGSVSLTDSFQVEEGSVATPFQKYRTTTAKTAKY
jgi:hypothetical protein